MVNLYLEKYNVDEGSRRPGTDQRGWLLSFSVAGLDQAFMQIFINYGEWLHHFEAMFDQQDAIDPEGVITCKLDSVYLHLDLVAIASLYTFFFEDFESTSLMLPITHELGAL